MQTITRILCASFAITVSLAAGGAQEAGGELVVSPKNAKTIFHANDGTTKPGTLRYRIKSSKGKGKWELQGYESFLSAQTDSGTVSTKKKVINLESDAAKIASFKPGIYDKKIKWAFSQRGTTTKVPRNITLIVEGDPTEGETFFVNNCSGCHSMSNFHDPNKQGPSLGTVYGRKAGTLTGFSYTNALSKYGKVWEEDNLYDWLRNSQKLVKNSGMYMILKNSKDRMDVIAYLKSVSP